MSDQPSAWQGELDRADLIESRVPADPMTLFADWYAEVQALAKSGDMLEPTAMTLATVDPDGTPSARIVLLKGFDEAGFRFYTNYNSRKGAALAANQHAALVFWWERLERQVRVTGPVEKLDPAASDAYFDRRSRDSQIGAHASPQSQRLPDRAALDQRLTDIEARYAGQRVPRPGHWGGYVVVPAALEFWQARRSRLHDRLRYYARDEHATWQIERLSP